MKAQGWKVMGRVAVANMSPYKHATSWQQLGGRNPQIAAGRGQVTARLEAILRLRAFRADHRGAKARWIAGERDVVFPAGTYWMRVHHRANVAGFG